MARAIPTVRDNTLSPPVDGAGGDIRVGGAEWWRWLEAPASSSFRFEHGLDGFTARREQRSGGWYWYAYRRRDGRLNKAYLGRATELSPDRLHSVSGALAGRASRRADERFRSRALAAPTAEVRRHNLPEQTTSFVGRTQALSDVRRLLGTSRLLTLTGPGGVGKTRLALQVATDVMDAYPDGAWLVDLAALRDPQLVPHAVANAVGVRMPAGFAPFSVLADALHARTLLLVLDNCEHLVQVCAELVDTLLHSCPHVCILATSRAVLDVPGETNWRVPPLGLSDAEMSKTVDEVQQSEAASLFVERAQATRPGFSVDERTAPAVASICRRLDGLPLGIELAAARMSVLTPEQIVERLDHALSLLVSGPRTAPARHHALRAALDWSYGLLGESERRVFERASVFAGGWTLEAAEAVCSGEGVEPSSMVDQLGHLVDQSLVVAEPNDDRAMRYRLLEPLRQSAAEWLQVRGDADVTGRRHAAYYTQLGEHLGSQWLDRDPTRHARLLREHDNVRAALRWLIDRGQVEPAQQLAGAVGSLWQESGRAEEGREWLFEILALPTPVRSAARARALIYASVLAGEQGDYAAARPLVSESLGLARELGDGPTLAYVLHRAAQLAWLQREFGIARELADEGVQVSRAVGIRNLEGINLWQVAQATHDLGEPGAAPLAEEALAIFAEVRNPAFVANALTTLAQVHLAGGRLASARRLLERAVAEHPVRFQGVAQLWTRVHLGRVACEQGDLERAHVALLEAFAIGRDALGGRVRLVMPLEGLAQVATAAGQPLRALRLAGAATALREAHSNRPTPTELVRLERWLTRARAAVGRSDADAAWESGRQLTPAQAAAEALALEVSTMPRRSLDPLTPREREVAGLVGNGASTREIAGQLVISQNTVRLHVERILSKLGLHSRAQLAAWAVQSSQQSTLAD
jgi:predicted ATPase/DNA-binding CsgD family transcriptional regulator